MVCVRLMTCVPHAVLSFEFPPSPFKSSELWRFSTSSRVWELANSTAANGAGPSARYSNVMTSVGLDLWLHGGETDAGEGETCATRVVLLLLP